MFNSQDIHKVEDQSFSPEIHNCCDTETTKFSRGSSRCNIHESDWKTMHAIKVTLFYHLLGT